ncbi:sensor histidine kinase [Methanothermobacter sp. THM-2]|uniref:sensor histidine kinase n=1 Tax=Methanothermobacter sp. THM-2 TaxID=2606912 RepID=UPI0013667557|nr:histidine kinase dimerization/phosphoacceptor domain -containing protein [Methanothermobacter sp. THM-2]QHN07330.1 response regulator [Methanothermobacter sp. THM-2]
MTCRILILEDVPLDVELMEREIRRSGIDFISETVEGEEDFVRALHEFKPDVILADHSLPSFDGLSALAIAHKLCPDVPFIFVSGKIGEEFAVKALKSGATDYVLKSNFSKVPVAIRRALREVEKERELERTRRSLAESHWQLKEAQRIGKIGSWQWNFDSEALSCSDEALRILGIRKDDFGGTLDEMVSRIHPEDRESFIDSITKKEPFEGEYRVVRDESVAYVLFRAKVLSDSRGNPISMIGIKQDITEDKNIRKFLEASLREKEFLMSEIHHRVKNNLQLIISLLSLQIRYAEDPAMEHFFRDYVNQLRSIAVIHERAYPSGGSYIIDFGDYLRSISSQLLESHGASSSVRLDIMADDVRLNMDTAVPLALIISELISNSLKHAFEGEGRITISIEKMNGSYLLVYTDDGRGLPDGIKFPDGGSFGFRMIENLSMQLGGNIRVEKPERGVKFTFEFTEQVYSNRMS